MKHVFCHQFVQQRVYCLVRYLATNYLIYIFSGSGLIVWIGHDEQDVDMRQTTFLVFEGPCMSSNFSEDFVLKTVLEQGIQFEFEDAGDQVWAVVGFLKQCAIGISQEAGNDFFPAWV